MKWVELTERSGYLELPLVLIPFYRLDSGDLLLFDSGAYPEPQLFADLAARGARVAAVLSTHLHWDHMGNNAGLIKAFGTTVYADPAEIRRLLALGPPPYPVAPLPEGAEIRICGAEIGVIPTTGHTPGHTSFVTPDGVCCLGDAMMDHWALRGSKLPYMEDVELALKSMERLRSTGCAWYVASHCGVVNGEELPTLVDANVEKELRLYALLREQITGPISREELLQRFFRAADIHRLTPDRSVWLRRSALVRLQELLRAGEYEERDGIIRPVK